MNIPLTPVMDMFIEVLLRCSFSVKKYFIQWLKFLLDDHSRSILPKLYTDYQSLRDHLLSVKENDQNNHAKIEFLTQKLKEKNMEMVHSSLGLEHLFRELGQIYEARMDSCLENVSESLKKEADRLSYVVAEIMLEGYSLELMDGDVSHVPLTWVLKVIENLQKICENGTGKTKGGKLFVLSVLGTQSSGKSTLLNTMFGIQFNVSVGRCARGAFFQVLALDSTLTQNLGYSHILIVDTEGLRAPEIQLEGLKHDNELSAFVIGLADATIINIFGETPGDINDILQTSIHAFIRKKQVKMSPSCLFVHQNVPDPLASTKSKLGRQKFQAKLDEITIAAAKIEQCVSQYKCFHDVILFEDSKDVFYVPPLWKGNPPMAPVNVGYSNSTHNIKKQLIEYMKSLNCYCTFEVFKIRVKTLWNAVLQENFVFNFKNTLEVCAYNELDSQYMQWSWTLQHKMLEWKQKARNLISSCDCQSEDIHALQENCLADGEKTLSSTFCKLCGTMKHFFENNSYCETLLQWEHHTKQRLQDLREDNERKARRHCDDLVKHRLNQVKVEDLEKTHVKELQKHIRKLVQISWDQGKELDDDDMQRIFTSKWDEWIKSIQCKGTEVIYPTDREIDTKITSVLKGMLQSYETMIVEKLSNDPLSHRNRWVPSNMFKPSIHISKRAHQWKGSRT